MKFLKKTVMVFLCVMLLTSTVGCQIPFVGEWKKPAVKNAEAIPKIAFGEQSLTEKSPVIFTEEELLGEELVAYDYRGSYHFDRLSDERQLVYTALEYALENGYPYVYVDEKIISRSEALGDVLERLALDSPLLEQNLSYQTGEFTTYYDVKGSSAELTGCYIKVDNFDSRHWKKKMEAVEAAKELIAALPKGMSEKDTAEYLHRLMLDNIDYYDYSDKQGKIGNYLYDALITGETHCDGSANAYSLLLNLAGIQCLEKQYTGENTVGHTWNMANLDGKWYNIDATAVEERDSEDYDYRVRKLFAFSDKAQQYTPDFSASYPEATDDLGMKINAEITRFDANDFVRRVKTAYRENNEEYACFIVYNFNESVAERGMKMLANELDSAVYWILYEGKDEANKNKAILVVFSEK